jgi:hypothetical protein
VAVAEYWHEKYGLDVPVDRATLVREFPDGVVKTRQNPQRILGHYILWLKQWGFVEDEDDKAMWDRASTAEAAAREAHEAYWEPRREAYEAAVQTGCGEISSGNR